MSCDQISLITETCRNSCGVKEFRHIRCYCAATLMKSRKVKKKSQVENLTHAHHAPANSQTSRAAEVAGTGRAPISVLAVGPSGRDNSPGAFAPQERPRRGD